MLQMLKKELQMNRLYATSALIFIPVIYMLNGSMLMIYLFAIFFFQFYVFYHEDRAQINQYLVSLPVSKKDIVLSKYIFMVVSFFILIIYHIIIDKLAHYGLPYLDAKPINGLTIVTITAGVILSLAVSLPIYYYFQSVVVASFVHVFLLAFLPFIILMLSVNPYLDFSKAVVFIFDIIDLQPYIIPIAFSFVCLLLSYQLSTWMFGRKDLR